MDRRPQERNSCRGGGGLCFRAPHAPEAKTGPRGRVLAVLLGAGGGAPKGLRGGATSHALRCHGLLLPAPRGCSAP